MSSFEFLIITILRNLVKRKKSWKNWRECRLFSIHIRFLFQNFGDLLLELKLLINSVSSEIYTDLNSNAEIKSNA